ncbi:MAG: glycosyltransferase family protein [Ignavibacteriae bacterium]|nr:glycosyltransferase family protein [Ignavibacteriota bacterium]
MLKIATIIQARTSSTRLPNKILYYAAGKQLLIHMVERVKKAKYSGRVIVATTTNEEDNIIEELCIKNNIDFYRGHATDLLDRHYKTALKYDAEVVVKIPSDCPLIDPQIIDRVIGYFIENIDSYDFVSNLRPPTYPDGNDVEVMSMDTLRYIWKEAKKEYEREHTTPYIWTHPEIFDIGNVIWNTGFDFSKSHRWTLDYEEDYTFIRMIYEELYHSNPNFGLYDILDLLENKPYIGRINNKHVGKFWYNDNVIIAPKLRLEYGQ